MKTFRTILALSLLSVWACAHADDEADHSRDPIPPGYEIPEGFVPKVGAIFPQFRLRDMHGNSVELSKFRGSYTVVNFFFSSCAPCIRDVPALNAFMKENSGINVVAITFEPSESAHHFALERGFHWPVLVEAQDYFDAIGVLSFPSFVLLDKDGRMVSATYGNRLGGEDGTVTAAGLSKWVRSLTP